jgi:mannose-6-phosphate isomerase-like protein (cupin superfamily)
MLEQIIHAGQLFAIVLRAGYQAEGIVFFTPGDFSQQLGYMRRPKGHVIPPHVHNEVVREVTLTNEVLFVRSGRVRVDFYDEERRYLESRVLGAGDIILLARGGHGFEMLEPSEMVEVKQGPYASDADKTRFAPAGPPHLRIVGD